MKKLVVFFSLEGNTRLVAREIAEEIGADVLQLKPVKPMRDHGFLKFVFSGRQAVRGEKPELHPFDFEPEEYEMLFIGTPVWAGRYSSPLRTFFSAAELKDKKVGIFCTHGGSRGKALEMMEEALSGNQILGKIDLRRPLKNPEATGVVAREWAKNVLSRV